MKLSVGKTQRIKKVRSRVFAAAATFITLAAVFFLSPYFGETEASGVANSVIIQLVDDPAAVWKAKEEKAGRAVSAEQLQAYRNSLNVKQDQFLAALQAAGISYQMQGVDVPNFDGTLAGRVDYRFNLVLNGVTLQVPASKLNIIKAMPQVKKVEPNDKMRILLNKSVPYVNAPAVYGQYAELTPFDNFREGYEGQGVNVAVLDTGIEWQHPMFGGDPTPPRLGLLPPTAATNSNQKVIYYMTFTGGIIDDFGHGSAASSNIAGYLGIAPGPDMLPGTLDDIRVHGVAPQAKLMGYKVCTGTGSCLSASTILAIEDAVSPMSLTLQPKPVAHVINLSLGGSGGPDDDTATAASNAALLGTIVVASAGNEGPGEATIGSPAAGRHVIAVGANTDPAAGNTNWSIDVLKANTIPQATVGGVTPASQLATEPGFGRTKLYPMAGSPDPASGSVAQRYVFVNNPAATYPAMTGRIALVKDSGLASATFFDIANKAVLAGAVGVVLISETTNPTAITCSIPAAIVSPTDGEVLVDALLPNDNNNVDPPNGTLSTLPIRLNPFLTNTFMGEMASFSSRGPVMGLGQVKPDVTAPGVSVLSATVRVGGATTGGGTMFDPTGYIGATGTSFSGPHVAGQAAILRQSHLNWTPDVVRAAMINTSTNLRTETGVAKADSAADSIIDQGGGLIDVAAAVNTKAVMGVAGDGIIEPGLLASHSFGDVAVLNNRITNNRTVTVTIKDVSGQGGTYSLSTVNNRSTNAAGFSTAVSPSSVSVPAGGSTTFTATLTIDGNVARGTSVTDLQWYVVATRTTGNNKIRMPMFARATASLPSDEVSGSIDATYTGTVTAGDAGVQRDNEIYLLSDTTYVDVPFEVGPSGLNIEATLSWDYTEIPVAGVGLPDLDFLLFDPNENLIGSSGNSSGPEHISVNATIPGTYIYRVYGWANAPTDFTIESSILTGGAAPTVQPFAADFVQGASRYDFDGNLTINWTPQGTVLGYEIENSTDGVNWSVVATAPANATSAALNNVANGTNSYRMRSIMNGREGFHVTIPSNTQSIIVSRREQVDATNAISILNRSITFPAGATELVSALKNGSATTYYPHLFLEIVAIQSAGNSVRVSNADNGGNGVATPAVFDYSQLVGADFLTNEESGNKTIRFSNPNTVLFTFTARIKANVASATNGPTNGPVAGANLSEPTGNKDSNLTNSGVNNGVGHLLRFTVDPTTRTISLKGN